MEALEAREPRHRDAKASSVFTDQRRSREVSILRSVGGMVTPVLVKPHEAFPRLDIPIDDGTALGSLLTRFFGVLSVASDDSVQKIQGILARLQK